MTRQEFDTFCATLPGAEHVVQWRGSSVWKVGGKIFAICSQWRAGEGEKIRFKCSDIAYRLLCERPGVAPSPYLARAKWVAVGADADMGEEDIRAYIREAHKIVSAGLSGARRREIGLMP